MQSSKVFLLSQKQIPDKKRHRNKNKLGHLHKEYIHYISTMNYRLTFVLLSISLRVLQYVDILDQRFRRNPVLKVVYVHPNTR